MVRNTRVKHKIKSRIRDINSIVSYTKVVSATIKKTANKILSK